MLAGLATAGNAPAVGVASGGNLVLRETSGTLRERTDGISMLPLTLLSSRDDSTAAVGALVGEMGLMRRSRELFGVEATGDEVSERARAGEMLRERAGVSALDVAIGGNRDP